MRASCRRPASGKRHRIRQRQSPVALAGRREDRVGQRGRGGGVPGFADAPDQPSARTLEEHRASQAMLARMLGLALGR